MIRSSLLLAAMLFAVPSGFAQDPNTPVELDETLPYLTGARNLAMGGAQLGGANDPTALVTNPAALARFTRIQISGGIGYQDLDWTLSRSGTGTRSQSTTILDHLIGVFPVGRRHVVMSFGTWPVADLSKSLFMQGSILDTPEGLDEVELLQQTGNLRAYGGGFGVKLSEKVSLGLTFGFIDGKRRETSVAAHGVPSVSGDSFGLCYSCGGFNNQFKEQTTRTLGASGFLGKTGFLIEAAPDLTVGFVVEFPTRIEYAGNSAVDFADYYGEFETDYRGFFDRIDFPWTFGGGLTWTPARELTLAGDVRWADWSQLDFEGPIFGPTGELAYRSTVSLHAGLEWSPAQGDVALRAGYMFLPVPYRLISAEATLNFDPGEDGQPGTDDDISYVTRGYPAADISDRHVFSGGLGWRIDNAFRVDAGVAFTNWDRKSAVPGPYGATSESADRMRGILSATFEF